VKRFGASFLAVFAFCLGSNALAAQSQPSQPQSTGAGAAPAAAITLPAGTKIELFLLRPVWAVSAKAGDPLYAQVSFPAVADDRVVIPAGAYVLGTIEDLTKPTRRSSRAQIEVLFTKIIFANGYTVVLPGGAGEAATAPTSTAGTPKQPGETLMAITVQVTTANDLLLDNGAGIEMALGVPLALDTTLVAQSLPMSHAPQPSQFKSATMCRYVPGSPGMPGSPGTPDTVIPGSPGTPSTTIPGGPGMPDITIPGTPATPPTVIPGSPGTPGTPGTPGRSCPPAPLVISCVPVTQNKQQSTSQPVAAN
jgi:hypothetical protein